MPSPVLAGATWVWQALVLATGLSAQCANPWLPGQGVAGIDGSVSASTLWDPDGAGPQPPVVVFGGWFHAAGGTPADRIVKYDPTTGAWAALGSITTSTVGEVLALVDTGSATLVAGGSFAGHIARWDGSNWQTLGSGLGTSFLLDVYAKVRALAIMPNGDLIAAGDFVAAGGITVNDIARWNGSTWAPLGPGLGVVPGSYTGPFDGGDAMVVLPNGDLIVGGRFATIGGVAMAHVARWNGVAWSPMGVGLPAAVSALTVLANGDVLASTSVSTSAEIHRWNGVTWVPLVTLQGPGFSEVHSLWTLITGDVVAAGSFEDVGGTLVNGIARWNGSLWSGLGGGMQGDPMTFGVNTVVETAAGEIIAGGRFTSAGAAGASNVAKWTGGAWSALHDGIVGSIRALLAGPGDEVVVGGDLAVVSSVGARHIARLSGGVWSPLGSGTNAAVRALSRMANGDIVAGGAFTLAGGAAAGHIARWNGATWSPLGTGVNGDVLALSVLPNGDLVAAGDFTMAGGLPSNRIARWDGTAWLPIGIGFNAAVHALLALPNGDIVAGGEFLTVAGPNYIARWNGSTWLPLGFGSVVYALARTANGDILAASGGVSRWNGTTWTWLNDGNLAYVTAIQPLPGGDFLFAGTSYYTSGTTTTAVRSDGVTAMGLGNTLGPINPYAAALAAMPNGDVLVGGDFTSIGGVVAAGLARWSTTCPALATPYGAGCSGSAGPAALMATELPWLGGTFRALSTGQPANSFAVGIYGLGAIAAPLSSIMSAGAVGCTLLVTPDHLDVRFATSGTTESRISIPNAAALIGQVVYHQVAPVELGPAGVTTAVTTTNALQLTIGKF